jgi:SPX domain protein involved in polyphosphate accumulation
MDAEFEELVHKGKKSRQEAEAMIQLANEVQYAILTKKLKPGTNNLDLDMQYFLIFAVLK